MVLVSFVGLEETPTMRNLASLARLDGVAQAELVARGEVTATELLDACAARIDAIDPVIHATVTLDLERARTRAASIPKGEAAGPLSGVPLLLKDVMPYPGMRWSIGSRIFAKNSGPSGTPYTDRLDAGGLVTMGKTSTSEFGLLGSTETLLEGVTHNPWDLSRSAAGSSGGAAAAVAAGIVPFAHASDGGGSVRIPAAVCGLFGFKPSRGRTVRAALADNDYVGLTSDHCISRSVRDSAAFLALTEDREGPLPAVGFVREPLGRHLRIGAWTRTLVGAEPHPVVMRAHDDAVALLVALGHRVESIAPPDVEGMALGEAFFDVAGAAIGEVLGMVTQMTGAPPGRDALEPFTWALVEHAKSKGPHVLERARAVFAESSARYRRAVESYDVVLTPTLAEPPWKIGHLSPILPREELIARTARAVGYTPIHNVVGCPAMSVPLCFPDGELPLGAHFAAPIGGDALLLGLAYELEAARPWADRWAGWSIPMI
jgi:amidase